MCKEENLRDSFEEKFPGWVKAVVKYCKETQVRSSSLQAETMEYSDTMIEGMQYLFYIITKAIREALVLIFLYSSIASTNIRLCDSCFSYCG